MFAHECYAHPVDRLFCQLIMSWCNSLKETLFVRLSVVSGVATGRNNGGGGHKALLEQCLMKFHRLMWGWEGDQLHYRRSDTAARTLP